MTAVDRTPTSPELRAPHVRWRRRAGFALLVPAGLLAMAGCGSSSKSTSSTTAPAGTTASSSSGGTAASGGTTASGATATLKIGEIDSLTGTFAQYGVPQHNAIELGINQINAAGGLKVGGTTYKLSLTAVDDKTDAATGALDMQKLLGENIHFIIGTLSSAVADAYLPEIKTNANLIDMVTGAAATGITAALPVYRPRVTQDQYVPAQVTELQSIDPPSKAKKIGNMYDQGNAGSVSSAPIIGSDLKALGYTVNQLPFTAGSAQFGAQLSNIKSAGDSVVLFGGNASDEATFIKEARQQGYTGDMISTTGIAASNVTSTAIPAADMKGLYDLQAASPADLAASGTDVTKFNTFSQQYKAAYGAPPGFTSGSAYDGVYILADALTMAGSVTNFSAIHSTLDSITVAQVPQLVEAIIPQGAQGLVFKNHQSYFDMAIHTWNGTAFILNKLIKNSQ